MNSERDKLLSKTIGVAFLWLLLPAAELVSLRLFLKFVLELKIGFYRTTDFDYFFSVPVAACVLVHCLRQARPLIFSLQRKVLVLNLLSVTGFLALNLYIKFFSQGNFPAFFWGMSLVSLVATSFFVFLPFSCFTRNPNRFVIFPVLLIVFIFPLFMSLPEVIWEKFGALTSHAIQSIFQTFFSDSVTVGFNKFNRLTLKYPNHLVLIGRGCGGLDGMFLFLITFFIFISLYREDLSPLKTSILLLMGGLLMFIVNLLRIFLLFWMGVFLKVLFGYETGESLFRGIAHTHLGWILYLLALSVFFSAVYFHLERRKVLFPQAVKV